MSFNPQALYSQIALNPQLLPLEVTCREHHLCLLAAAVAVCKRSLWAFSSFLTVLWQVSQVWPCFLFPWTIHPSQCCPGDGFRWHMCPSHLQWHSLMSLLIGGIVIWHSRSTLEMVLGQKNLVSIQGWRWSSSTLIHRGHTACFSWRSWPWCWYWGRLISRSLVAFQMFGWLCWSYSGLLMHSCHLCWSCFAGRQISLCPSVECCWL